ncbi:hypothetical protein BH23CHL7_BH23CHL7_09780 [soil metagenome]
MQIDDGQFEGAFAGRRSGTYLGRTASWVYGQGTRSHTMTASFRLRLDGEVGRRASFTIVGMDGENRAKNTIAVVLNGVTIYEGPNPLPNDACCDPPGNWGSAVIQFRGDLLKRRNTLSISNLEPDGCTRCPVYVMVDYVELTYRLRPPTGSDSAHQAWVT